MLKLNNIEVIYSSVILVLRGVSLVLNDGQITCILGANGAGKSTVLKAISGLLKTELGEVTHGNIDFDGVRIDKKDPEEIANMGITQVIEGRRLYPHLSAEENLLIGAYVNPNAGDVRRRLGHVYDEYFPILKEIRKNISGYLSGGEQQMMVIARSMMARPKIMLLDEPTLGLAPQIIKHIFQTLNKINTEEKVSMLLVEQNAMAALSIAGFGYVMENGRVVLDGVAEKLRSNEDIKEFYLGLSQVGAKKSYREVKHYKRRKRWLG